MKEPGTPEHRGGSYILYKRKICSPYQDSNPAPSIPLCSRYTDSGSQRSEGISSNFIKDMSVRTVSMDRGCYWWNLNQERHMTVQRSNTTGVENSQA
jgi:hypothetical protein